MALPEWAPYAGALTAIVLAALLVRQLRRRAMTPDEEERRRRIRLQVIGRMGECMITNADELRLHYSYEVAGVEYATTQELTHLQLYLPAPPQELLGPAMLKYDPANPANSMVICEHWAGVGVRRPAGRVSDAPAARG